MKNSYKIYKNIKQHEICKQHDFLYINNITIFIIFKFIGSLSTKHHELNRNSHLLFKEENILRREIKLFSKRPQKYKN